MRLTENAFYNKYIQIKIYNTTYNLIIITILLPKEEITGYNYIG